MKKVPFSKYTLEFLILFTLMRLSKRDVMWFVAQVSRIQSTEFVLEKGREELIHVMLALASDVEVLSLLPSILRTCSYDKLLIPDDAET